MTKTERKHYIKVAKDLLYPEEVIKKLENAVTEAECIRILHDARKSEE